MSDGESDLIGLLPCPWCGCDKVDARVSEICCPLQYSAVAYCTDCGAEEPAGSGVYTCKDDAIKESMRQWNERQVE